MSYYNGTITNGITLTGTPQNPATVGASGYITNTTTRYSGDAVYGNTAAAWTITNLGTLKATGSASRGVDLRAGGTVTNAVGARIVGVDDGVYIDSIAGSVTNSGTIQGTGASGYGIQLSAGGSVSNRQNALISGVNGGVVMHGAGTVSNLGTITAIGTAGYVSGIYLDSGVVVNGASNVTTALISGGKYGVVMAGTGASTIRNFGTISGGGTADLGPNISPLGVYIKGAGTVINGATNATSALISSVNYAIKMASSAAGTVVNYGTIISTIAETAGSLVYPDAIFIAGTGSVVNGATNATSALISAGHRGIYISGAGVSPVSNFGTIRGTGTYSAGIYLSGAGTVSNAQSGLISGLADGVVMQGTAASTVSNSGTITGGSTGNTTVYSFGVYIKGAGTVVNGAPNSTSALIRGANIGLGMEQTKGTATVTNFGTIIGGHGTTGLGVYVGDLGSVVNGASNVTSALISGGEAGIKISGASGTVTNFGTVTAGTNGTGIYLVRGQVTNFGTIVAPGTAGAAVRVRYGVFLNKGVVNGSVYGIELGLTGTGAGTGSVTVSSAGTVTGAIGIGAAPGITAGYTVTVSGTVKSTVGSAGTAVNLGGLTGRLIVGSGAVFGGLVDGGKGSSVLEFDAGSYFLVAPGQFKDFSSLQVDPDVTLATQSGVVSFDTLINEGTLQAGSGDSFAFGTVSAATAGVITFRGSSTVTVSGAVTNQTLDFITSGGTAAIDKPGVFSGTISGFAAGDTIDAGVAANGYVFAGGVLTLSNKGTVAARLSLSTPMTNPGFSLVGDGGSGTDITVTSNSKVAIVVSSGVTSSGLTLHNGDTETVLSGGTASSTTIQNGGTETVSAGGKDFTATISGKQYDYGTATSATVAGGGSQTVEPGGTASATTVSSGGTQIVSSGGIASATTIAGSGAVLDLLSGGVVSGGITFSGGGELEIAGTTMPGGTISGFALGDAIDLTSIAFAGTGSATLQSGNILLIDEDGGTFTLDLDPNQNFAGDGFQLSSDAAGGTLIAETTGPPAPGDFNGEVLWHDPATGDTGYWTTDSGGSVNGFHDLGAGSTAYAIAGVGDFDGKGKPEVLWHDPATGDTGYWTTDSGGNVAGFHDFGDGSTAYAIAGVGDFDGKGKSEVLWHDPATGDTGYWTTGSGGAVNGFHDFGDGSTAYAIAGIGDFDGKGRDELLWHDGATGDTGYWTTDSSGNVTGFHDLGAGSTAYAIAGVGAFDGSATPEILWHDSATGDTGYWTTNNSGSVTGFHDLGIGSTAYSIAGVGDFAGNGRSQVLWHDSTTGDTGYWAMDSSGNVTGFHDYGNGSTAYGIV